MEKNDTNLILFCCVFVVALVVSNILASKVIRLWVLEVPAAIVAYPITFLMTDVIGEIWGKRQAQKVVYIGIICQIIALVMIYLAIYLPPASYMTDFDREFRNVLNSTARVVLASMVGFIISQSWDVFAFHKLKDLFSEKKWLRNNASTMVSQVIDSTCFVFIAFSGLGYDIPLMIGSQILTKWIIALCDTPVFYALTYGSGKERQSA